MKKVLLILAGIILIAGIAAGAYLVLKDDNKPAPNIELGKSRSSESREESKDTEMTPEAKAARKACDIFTLEDSKKLLGGSAVLDSESDDTPKESGGAVFSTCSYSSAASKEAASLLVRTATSPEGSVHDKELFSTQKPANSQDVKNYGDMAYWNADFGQLNILKGNTWYIMTAGPQNAADRQLQDAEKLAELMKNKL